MHQRFEASALVAFDLCLELEEKALDGSDFGTFPDNFLRSLLAGLHKLWYPSIRDTSTWSKFGAHGEHGDVFLFSNLGAL